jgi:hypothetical protein
VTVANWRTNYGYDEWKDEQEKKKRGEIPSSKSPRRAIQYTIPSYQGRSDKEGYDSYEWEKDTLRDVKGKGRSYVDRYKKLMDEAGIPEGEQADFRRWLDAQEDMAQEVRRNKDGSLSKNQTIHLGQGMRTNYQVTDDILNSIYDKGITKAEKEIETSEKKNNILQESNEERDGILGLLDSTVGRFSNSAVDNLMSLIDPKFSEKQNENYERLAQNKLESNNLDRMEEGLRTAQRLNTTNREAEGWVEKGADISGDVIAELAKYIPAYKGANAVMRGLGVGTTGNASRLATDLTRGAIAGGIVGTSRAVTNERADETGEYGADDWLKNILGEAALAGAGDAAIGVAGRYIAQTKWGQDLIARFQRGQTPEQAARETGIPQETVEQVQRTVVEGTLPGQEVIDTAAPRLDAPRPEETLGIGGRVEDPMEELLGLNEPLYRRNVRGVGQEVNIEGTPQLNAPRNTPVQADELDNIRNTQQEYYQRRVAEEDAFVQERMKPIDDMLNESAVADAQFQDVVKKARDTKQRIQQNYGKIIVPEGNWADWGSEVPPAFRAKRGETKGVDLYTFADQEGFSSVDEAVQFLKTLDNDAKGRLKDFKPADDMKVTSDQYDELVAAARQEFNNTETAKGIDKLIDDLVNYERQAREAAEQQGDPLEFMRSRMFRVDNEPVSYVGRMDPNTQSAVRSEGSYSTRYKESPTGDTLEINPEQPLEFRRTVPQEGMRTTVEREVPRGFRSEYENVRQPDAPQTEPTPSQPNGVRQDGWIRGNLQHHNEAPTNPMVNVADAPESQTVIQSVKNPVRRVIDRAYELYANRTHSAKVADRELIKKQFDKAKAEGNTEKMKYWNDELKRVKKEGSDFDKALQNESASAQKAKSFLDKHFDNLQKSLGRKANDKDMAKALEYQMAKNLLWIKDNVTTDYKLPQGWTWERLASIEGAGKGKYDGFTDAFRNLTQEWRDTMLDYGMITREAHEALSQNPYYVPMFRDTAHRMDNIDLGNTLGSNTNKRSSDSFILFDLKEGDVNSFYKNPLESVVENSFTLFRNAMKNDTAQQAYRLAQLDTDGSVAKVITKEQYEKNGGLEVNINGEKKYVRLQDDLMKVLKENEAGLDLNKLAEVTSLFARLKTSSFEYQSAAIPRDLTQGYVTSQIGNPFRYAKELATAVKRKNAKEAGAVFDRAYSDATMNLDPKKITKEYQKQFKNVSVLDKNNVKEAGNFLLKIAKLPLKPAQKLGQFTDEIVREVEVNATTQRFMKKYGEEMQAAQSRLDEINTRLAQSEGLPDFDPRLQGIDTLQQEKTQLEDYLRKMNQDLRREQTFRGRDVMNYSRMGRAKTVQEIRKYIIFANTTTQSKDKIIRSFVERPVQTSLKAAGVVAPFVGLHHLNQQYMSREDRELYEETPDYVKQFNYVYVNDGKVLAVPKLHELALIVNPMESILADEPLNEDMRLAVKEAVPLQIGTFAQGLVPEADGTLDISDNVQLPTFVGSPIVDMKTNEKSGFNGNPISFQDAYRNEDVQPNDWTLDIMKNLGLGGSRADYAEYAIRQYGGDLGKYGLYGMEYLMEPSNQDKLDMLLENLNPLQDRMYQSNSRWWKDPYRQEKDDKK